MTSISAVQAGGSILAQTATASATAQPSSNAVSASAPAPVQPAGSALPPVGLVWPASVNTLNASLVASEFGVDPTLMSGVYGSTSGSDAVFGGAQLLPLLASLPSQNAAQALALLGIHPPTAGSSGSAAAPSATESGTTSDSPAKPSGAAQPPATESLAQSASGPAQVDPLFGPKG